QGVARRKLAPAHGHVAVEGEQARGRTALHDLSERHLVFLARPLAIGAADPPPHAPAAIAGAVLAEQVLERRPQIGRERADSKLHATFLLIMELYVYREGVTGLRAFRRCEPGQSGWVNSPYSSAIHYSKLVQYYINTII